MRLRRENIDLPEDRGCLQWVLGVPLGLLYVPAAAAARGGRLDPHRDPGVDTPQPPPGRGRGLRRVREGQAAAGTGSACAAGAAGAGSSSGEAEAEA